VVARSRVRLSRMLGVPLFPRVAWHLHRSRRPADLPRRRPARDLTDYRMSRREERQLRKHYHLRGPGLRRACAEAARRPGDPAESLVELLERRLDTLVWRAGFAASIHHARRLVERNHFTVDGEPVDLPSYELRPGQVVEVRPTKIGKPCFVAAAQQRAVREPTPPYVEVRPERLSATLTHEPRRDEVPMPAAQQLTVEVRRPR
jgi:small subunit ribosomal protein S4